jgi:hypothetical protein
MMFSVCPDSCRNVSLEFFYFKPCVRDMGTYYLMMGRNYVVVADHAECEKRDSS